jgi:hypothetical protein
MSYKHGTYNIVGNFAKLKGGCNGNDCIAEPVQTDSVIYSGPNLPCTGIHTCDSLTTMMEKLDNIICAIQLELYNMNTTTTSTTTI